MNIKEAKAVCRELARKYFRASPARMMAEEMIEAGVNTEDLARKALGIHDDWRGVLNNIRDFERTGAFVAERRHRKGVDYEVAR